MTIFRPACLPKAPLFALLAALQLAGCAAPPPVEPTNWATYPTGAVATDHPVASAAGAEMLRLGGNAVDAAVASSFCLSVVRPYSCGIGGGGFMVIHDPERGVTALDYRERAPQAVGPDHFVDLEPWQSTFGPHSCGVPGTVAGLLHALERYGTLDRATVLEPAIRAAREGYVVDDYAVSAAEAVAERLEEHPELKRRARYLWDTLCNRGKLAVGDVVRDLAQADALELIAEEGRDAFYTGRIAHAIVAAMEPGGGEISMADLAAYEVKEVEPFLGTFAGCQIIAMPLPSSGGITLIETLGILERSMDVANPPPHNSAAYVHQVVEALKHAFADRSRWLADPEFVDVPTDALMAEWYLADRAALIGATPLPTEDYGTSRAVLPDDGGTSHISVIDAGGMAVACTETINLRYGSLVGVPGFGFTLNDEMDDFTTKPGATNAYGLTQSDRNLPAPGKRPLSSMSPTIVLRDGKVVMVAGASGGPRIITGTLQAILNVLLFDYSAGQAVGEPRFHHQWQPDCIRLEDVWTNQSVVQALEAMGHEIEQPASGSVVQVLRVGPQGIEAASDPRKGGRPDGH